MLPWHACHTVWCGAEDPLQPSIKLLTSNKDLLASGPDGTHPLAVAGCQSLHQLHLPGLGVVEQDRGPSASTQVVKDVPCLGVPWH